MDLLQIVTFLALRLGINSSCFSSEFDFPENTTIHFSNIKYIKEGQELFGKIQYEKNKSLDSMCEQLLEEPLQKRIEQSK